MTDEIPKNLIGILASGDTKESLIALRDFLGRILDSHDCEACKRSGPDAKDVASLTLRLMNVLKEIDEFEEPKHATVTTLSEIQGRALKRTGAGTQNTGAPTSVAKRQGGRRPQDRGMNDSRRTKPPYSA